MGGRRPGKTRPRGGHEGRRSPASRTGTAPTDAQSPSGRASTPAAQTTSARTASEIMANSAAGEARDFHTQIIEEFLANQGLVDAEFLEGLPVILIHPIRRQVRD